MTFTLETNSCLRRDDSILACYSTSCPFSLVKSYPGTSQHVPEPPAPTFQAPPRHALHTEGCSLPGQHAHTVYGFSGLQGSS